MDDNLFNVMNSIITSNQSMITHKEPEISTPDEALIKIFQKEQSAKMIYQPILIIGLLIFLFIQVVFMNNLYGNSIDKLIAINNVDSNMAENYFALYSQILKQLQFYTTAVLCEFIAMLYFIIRWGFSTTITDMFSDFFKKGGRNKKQKNERKK